MIGEIFEKMIHDMKVIIKRCLVFKFWKNNFPFGSGLSKNQAKKNVLSPKLNQIFQQPSRYLSGRVVLTMVII